MGFVPSDRTENPLFRVAGIAVGMYRPTLPAIAAPKMLRHRPRIRRVCDLPQETFRDRRGA